LDIGSFQVKKILSVVVFFVVYKYFLKEIGQLVPFF